MGGKGERTLEVVARHATEWNCSYVGLDVFRTKSAQLDENCVAIDRDPASLRRSLMVPFVIGADATSIQNRINKHRTMFPNLPVDLGGWHKAGFVGGTPDQLLDQLKAFEAAGVHRFMLQHNDLEDVASLELLAGQILPHFDS